MNSNSPRQFWFLVKTKDEPGSGAYRAYITATNPFEASQMAKALYGRLLITECAQLVM